MVISSHFSLSGQESGEASEEELEEVEAGSEEGELRLRLPGAQGADDGSGPDSEQVWRRGWGREGLRLRLPGAQGADDGSGPDSEQVWRRG